MLISNNSNFDLFCLWKTIPKNALTNGQTVSVAFFREGREREKESIVQDQFLVSVIITEMIVVVVLV